MQASHWLVCRLKLTLCELKPGNDIIHSHTLWSCDKWGAETHFMFLNNRVRYKHRELTLFLLSENRTERGERGSCSSREDELRYETLRFHLLRLFHAGTVWSGETGIEQRRVDIWASSSAPKQHIWDRRTEPRTELFIHHPPRWEKSSTLIWKMKTKWSSVCGRHDEAVHL